MNCTETQDSPSETLRFWIRVSSKQNFHSHFANFFAKINKAKTKRNFAKIFFVKMQMRKFREIRKIRENHECYSCNNKLLKRTCGIICSYTSIFEVLSCHINNFSSFTLINV